MPGVAGTWCNRRATISAAFEEGTRGTYSLRLNEQIKDKHEKGVKVGDLAQREYKEYER